MHIRTRVLGELRDTLSAAFDKPTAQIVEAAEWKAITILTRLSLASGHDGRLYHQPIACLRDRACDHCARKC
ncbi:hypothetical protein Clacol_004598 [Clathrus columnatus]|uniref:Uncharacterized protein n=1 Tax=Clathrus columnatus TaxID=1419009 RepID=A0AAV5A9J1_9AGAM|nr:hypothetical protein Clacol_004598 [Clathrus columnatus]